ncbi:MAG: hypothetical protein LBL60_01890 [Mycoplasmataceae bacterium]|jgi:flagellar biosynthesis chaperone FliJ|nr:hypothetical protein [Mycoplasmataceae bacterium]
MLDKKVDEQNNRLYKHINSVKLGIENDLQENVSYKLINLKPTLTKVKKYATKHQLNKKRIDFIDTLTDTVAFLIKNLLMETQKE